VAKQSTGIAGLDTILNGGIEEGRSLLLFAPPGSGKSTVCKRFAIRSLADGKRLIYISTGQPFNEWKKETRAKGKLKFIDCFSWRQAGENPKSTDTLTIIEDITDLNEFSLEVRKAVKSLGGLEALVLDSVSDLILYSEPKSVFRFLQMLQGLVESNNAAAFFSLEEGLHEDRVNTTINYISNGVIEMKTEDGKRELHIARTDWEATSLGWRNYRILPKLRLKLEGV